VTEWSRVGGLFVRGGVKSRAGLEGGSDILSSANAYHTGRSKVVDSKSVHFD
jgi:hypothetical protein